MYQQIVCRSLYFNLDCSIHLTQNSTIMMRVKDILHLLETLAPPSLQESYDNAGLITGQPDWECTGAMVCLDATEAVIQEAAQHQCNLVIAHHPILFKGLKRLNGFHYTEKSIIRAIKQDIAIYAIHTNLDNVLHGVNGKIADLLEISNREILAPRKGDLLKLAVFVPVDYTETLLQALFTAGAGTIGNYDECSFRVTGEGTFRAGDGAQPFVGEPGIRHQETENRVEVIFPVWLSGKVLAAMKKAHPYEEVAYDLIPLSNLSLKTGSGIIGELPEPVNALDFLQKIATRFQVPVIKYTPLTGKPIKRVAVCGGAGSFLTQAAISQGADILISADYKYHDFFEANDQIIIADIGHFESEQFTSELLVEVLNENFPTFAVRKTSVRTNPVQYFISRKPDESA